jgi:hypothetical protein
MSQPQPDLAAAVRALAAEVEAIQRRIADVDDAAAEATQSAAAAHRALADLAELLGRAGDVQADPDAAEPDTPPWLLLDDPDVARAQLRDLVTWLGDVYLRYHAVELRACWAWHPGVVTELLALRDGWTVAHYGERASAAAVLDWHDRYRPATVGRVARELAGCTLADHSRKGSRHRPAATARGTELLDELGTWWATTHGTEPAPPPTKPMVVQEATDLRAS